ncbi:uncharacterized protein MELLADRAFT_79147 [Melampsora larici-populina 98AG31]|uniref:Uncharacterized protein n=1 Tax=Melampsora larici-populina (strain 98AG31 / pathotype 3-4-7) TaxID=747676 RepID=F4S3D3_MELLP|nr:uncharacterized protein MELLADRAFT_79147 [Melampsora larici-populina 98AG31]EGG00858.1 hypothetical protein MELLADRAFT_79147 [Melampsora larici-populina 98AG31]
MLKSSTNQNHLNIYTISGFNLAIEILERLIQLAKPTTEPFDLVNDLKTNEDKEDSNKTYRLITKYYSANLSVKIIDVTNNTDQDFSDTETEDDHTNQVSIIVSNPNDSENLIDFLSTFNDFESELTMVILSTNQTDQNLNQIEESCQEFGFEFYDLDTLNEASMALQCVAWPKIEKHDRKSSGLEPDLFEENELNSISYDSNTSNKLPVDSLSEIDWSNHGKSLIKSTSKSSSSSDLTTGLENQFEDDFSPFVSAELTSSSSTTFDPFNQSDYDQLEDQEGNQATEDEELNEFLFGSNLNQSGIDEIDLETLCNKINSLKTLGLKMNEENRKKLASQVALLIENQL